MDLSPGMSPLPGMFLTSSKDIIMNQSAVDEALLGEAAETMLSGTQDASWRIYISQTVLDEVQRVLVDHIEPLTVGVSS